MRVQPVIVVSPLTWLLVTFWKPIVVGLVVLSALIYLSLPLVGRIVRDEALRTEEAVPTMYIPATWRASLTQAALTPTPSRR